MRQGNSRLQIRKVDLHDPCIFGIFIRFINDRFAFETVFDIFFFLRGGLKLFI